jgi:hypothetical protein
VCGGGNGSCTKTEESTEGSQTQTLGLRMSSVKIVGRQLRGYGQASSRCASGKEERYDRSRVIMEEPGGTMGRYWVAAHERVADGRRSVRRRGEETAAGG